MAKGHLLVKFSGVKKRVKQGETHPRYRFTKKSLESKCGAVHYVFLALRRPRKVDLELKANLSYITEPCLKNK